MAAKYDGSQIVFLLRVLGTLRRDNRTEGGSPAEVVVSTIALQEAKKRPRDPMHLAPTRISSPVRSPTLHRLCFYPLL